MTPWLSKNVTNITLFFDFWNKKMCVLKGLVSTVPCFLFVRRSYWKHQVSSPFTTESSKEWLSSRLNKLLTSLQSESLLFISQTVQIFHFLRPSTKILRTASLLILTSSSIIWRVIQQSVEINSRTVSIMSGAWPATGHPLHVSSSRFSQPSWNLAYHSKTHVQEREHCHLKTVLSAESFSSCFAHIETKLNVHSLLHHYELSQQPARYKILNTTEHKRQEGSHWPCTGNMMEEST
jgi:hypothetical protein